MKKLFLLTLLFFTAQLGFSVSQIDKQVNSSKQIAALGLNNAVTNQHTTSQVHNASLLNVANPSVESESSGFVDAILIVALIGLVLLISTTIYLGKKMIDKIV
jgi:hypothetical protein